MGYKSHAQRKAVHAHKADGGKGHPDKGSPAKKTNNDSIAASQAWKQFKKGYMDRKEKMGKPISAKENKAEYDREKNEFYYDIDKKKMRLIPTDDAERRDTSGLKSWQLAPSMKSPIDHKPMSGRSHIHRKSGRGVAYEGDASFEKFKKEGGAIQPKGQAYESTDAYYKDSDRNKPHKAPSMKSKEIVGQDTGKVKSDKKGEYVMHGKDTIRPADNKKFRPFVQGKQSGKMESGYLSDDNYTVKDGRLNPIKKSPLQMVGIQSPLNKISGPCKAAAKKKFKVWPSAYASGWGVRCTKAGGPSKYGGGKKK